MSSFYTQEELEKIGFNKIGKGNFISRKASIYGVDKIEIGNSNRIDDFSIISGNILIHDHVHIASGCYLFGGDAGIELRDFSAISSRGVVYSETDDYSGLALTNPTAKIEHRKIYGGKVILEKYVLIGTGCTILPGLVIGEGTSVGAMSLVNKSLDSWGVYVGIPCQRIKERKKDMLRFVGEYT